jgi:hypothetical protein
MATSSQAATSYHVSKREVKEESVMPTSKHPVARRSGIVIGDPVTQQPHGRLYLRHAKEEQVDEEPMLAAAARRQQQLRATTDPKDNPGYLKVILDSSCHRRRAFHV